jgi:hypothetical protein
VLGGVCGGVCSFPNKKQNTQDARFSEENGMATVNTNSGGIRERLERLAGRWQGITRTWFEPDVLADESVTQATFRLLLDGRFLLHEYEGSIQGKPLQGMAIYGFHQREQQWQMAWIDSFHMDTEMMFSIGDGGAGLAPSLSKWERPFAVLGFYAPPDGSPAWGWRTEIRIVSDDEFVHTAYNISPGGDEAKAVETVYRRWED